VAVISSETVHTICALKSSFGQLENQKITNVLCIHLELVMTSVLMMKLPRKDVKFILLIPVSDPEL